MIDQGFGRYFRSEGEKKNQMTEKEKTLRKITEKYIVERILQREPGVK